jgi:sporulation protein YlmC with PRC-barrel domain
MRLKQLRGLPVIDPTAAHRIGTVSDYQVDPASGRLAALDIDAMKDGGVERVMAQRIRRVGGSAVILSARGGAGHGPVPEINEDWLDTSTLVGLEVMGDDGNLIGQLVDATFNQDTLEVEAYLLRSTFFRRLFGRRGRIQPAKVHASSRELMIVTTGRVKELPAVPLSDESPTLSLRLPLKDEDRLAPPTYDQVKDGHPVGRVR